jgi:hypothetical protein
VIGQILDKQTLRAGRIFAPPDGANLSIVLQKKKLNIACDGVALSGTPDDPRTKLNSAVGAA